MKKGFTLVEVLAIIAVLGIILITVVPNIGGSIEKKKEEEYKKIINVIENAAKTYYSYNPNITSVTIETLLKENLITTDLINPVNDEKITGCVNVTTDEDGIKQFIFSDKCNVLLSTHIENLYNTAATENGLVKDDTDDQNIRYAGSDEDVKNYVSFDGEVWRIIGIVDGKVKLVKEKSIGDYSWDSSPSNMNYGHGYNIWETIDGQTKADLNILLNDGFYGGAYPSECYGGQNNTIKDCPTEYINSTLKSMVDENAIWYLGGHNTTDIQPKDMYEYERGTTVYSTDIAKTEWTGPVGLIYPSDYGYAADRTQCTETLNNYDNKTCTSNNWLYKNSYYWTKSPHSGFSYGVFGVSSSGRASSYTTYNADGVWPAVYLKSNVLIDGGTGTSTDPYILTINE